jgi:hypothetical protein
MVDESVHCKSTSYHTELFDIRGSHGSENIDYDLLGCDAVYSCNGYKRFGGTYRIHFQSSTLTGDHFK